MNEDKPLLDERLVLPGRGNSRDISRNPVFDGKVPTSRSKRQNKDILGVGPAGERYDYIASLLATPIGFRIGGGTTQLLTHSIGGVRGLSWALDGENAYTRLELYSKSPTNGTLIYVGAMGGGSSTAESFPGEGIAFNSLYVRAANSTSNAIVYGSIWLVSTE